MKYDHTIVSVRNRLITVPFVIVQGHQLDLIMKFVIVNGYVG